MEWSIIYHDGTNLSIVKSTEMPWNDAPTANVQILLVRRAQNHWHAIHGQDDYNLIACPGSETKTGLLITDEQWRQVRNTMMGSDWR